MGVRGCVVGGGGIAVVVALVGVAGAAGVFVLAAVARLAAEGWRLVVCEEEEERV